MQPLPGHRGLLSLNIRPNRGRGFPRAKPSSMRKSFHVISNPQSSLAPFVSVVGGGGDDGDGDSDSGSLATSPQPPHRGIKAHALNRCVRYAHIVVTTFSLYVDDYSARTRSRKLTISPISFYPIYLMKKMNNKRSFCRLIDYLAIICRLIVFFSINRLIDDFVSCINRLIDD